MNAVPQEMRAMLFERPGQALALRRVAVPRPGRDQVLVRVLACGVCRTDLHIVDGELTEPKLPLILGHEVVGQVAAVGEEVTAFAPGERVGIPWLGWTDGSCRYCRSGQENLCSQARFTGYTLDGGYAEYALADRRYCFKLPERYSDAEAAPLLCAGLIGYRSYRMAGPEAQRLGLYGFGAAAHLIAQLAAAEGKEVFAFTRPGDGQAQQFALRLGASWAGDSDQAAPVELDAAILYAPVGSLVPAALRAVRKAGVVVCAGIHMSDIPAFPYRWLWEERSVRSVANLTRQDGLEFLAAAGRVGLQVAVQPFGLQEANQALDRLRAGQINGAAVLLP